ncbi:MAG: hypothetical protein ACERKK_04435, partial [Poseidonibacter sp.]|uniref:hypothetical protein n=1 Tax=Poseidonibacter sp. TaxID=2321188 RepID=UPI00359D8AC7
KVKPNYIPFNPKIFYKEWISWDNWLGMEQNYNKNYLSYDKAKKIISFSNINTEQKWHEFFKLNNQKIASIPTDPEIYYNNGGWIS